MAINRSKPIPPDLTSLHTVQTQFGTIVHRALESLATDAPRIDLLHICFKEDRPDEHGLAEVVCNEIINYVIPKQKLKTEHEAISRHSPNYSGYSRLTNEARRAFIAYRPNMASGQPESRYSEIGEVIAFCLANHYLSAGQVAAKMALKTNSEMPVFGLDGIHVRAEDNGTVTLFFLESKMVEDAQDGGRQYAQSAAAFDSNRKNKLNELRIARDLSNLDILEERCKEAALAYFDPYSEESNNVRERIVGVIIYSEVAYQDKMKVTDATPIECHREHFVKNYTKLYDTFAQSLTKALNGRGADLGKCRAFFLAVPDIHNLKRLFAKEMNNEHIC